MPSKQRSPMEESLSATSAPPSQEEGKTLGRLTTQQYEYHLQQRRHRRSASSLAKTISDGIRRRERHDVSEPPLAVATGMEPAEIPTMFRWPKEENEFLRNAEGVMDDPPPCTACRGSGYVKVAPMNRASRGAWDTMLAVCPRWDKETKTCPVEVYG